MLATIPTDVIPLATMPWATVPNMYLNYAIVCICVFGSTTVALWVFDLMKRADLTPQGAPRFQINFSEVWRFVKGTGVMFAGATLAWLYSDYIPDIDQGTRAGIIRAAIATIAANALRLFITNNSNGKPPEPPQPEPAKLEPAKIEPTKGETHAQPCPNPPGQLH